MEGVLFSVVKLWKGSCFLLSNYGRGLVFCCQIMEGIMVYKLYFRRKALAIRQGTFHGYIPARGFSNK